MDEVSIEEGRKTLGDLYERVKLTGKAVRLTRYGKGGVLIVNEDWLMRLLQSTGGEQR